MRTPLILMFLAAIFPAGVVVAADPPKGGVDSLKPAAAEIYRKAQKGKFAEDAAKLQPEIFPTSDDRSFWVKWQSPKEPKRWIVSLHGSLGFATDDLAIWYPHLKDRDVGLLCLQWWLGTGEGLPSYFTPGQIYKEADLALQKYKVAPGTVMLHGFSRGAANSYAVAALDTGRGKKYFSLAVASSGGVGLDYPPNRAIAQGVFGNRPLNGTQWVTVAGGHDPEADRDGVAGMRKASTWLHEQGANVALVIEDPAEGHGALMRNPANAKQVLDLFFTEKK